jgi:hypothetical protein
MPWPWQRRSDEPQTPVPNSPPAWARPQQPTAGDANLAFAEDLIALANAMTWEQIWQVVTERQQRLLTDLAERGLQQIIQLNPNTPDAAYIRQRIQIIRDCRAKGIAATKAAYARAQTPLLIAEHYQTLKDALEAFVNAHDWEDIWRVLNERQQLLLSDEAVREMQLNISEQPAAAETFRHRLTILQYCRDKGIDAYKQTMVSLAVEAMLNARTWDEIWDVMTERRFWLFTGMADDLLLSLPEQRPDLLRQMPSLAKIVPQRLAFIRESRRMGIPAARSYFERKQQASE